MQKIDPGLYIPLPTNFTLRLFKELSYTIPYPLVSNMYLTTVSGSILRMDL